MAVVLGESGGDILQVEGRLVVSAVIDIGDTAMMAQQ